MSTEMENIETELKEYLSDKNILIVDSMSSARVSLAASLSRLGAVRQKMALVGSIEEARDEITRMKPKVVITDYVIGNKSGLDLIQNQRAQYDKEQLKDTIFVMITGNASQSVVARAAEEDVDTFVIKPYAMDTLKKALHQTITAKLRPSVYLQLINEGKELLFSANIEGAIVCFQNAMKEHPQPTLALFYYGQAELMKQAIEEAHDKFESGLEYNKIHYKCLVGLFDLLNSQKNYTDAYEVIKRLAQYFPANPKRLSSVLRLAIITENFADMEGYYRIFIKIDERTEELIRHMCSALLVTAKHYLNRKIKSRAMEIFENAAVSAGGRVQFLLYIVETLVQFKMGQDAVKFLDRIYGINPSSPEYAASKFLIATVIGDPLEAIHQGRTLVKEGTKVPSVYEKLIVLSLLHGQRDAAEELSKEACEKWPHKSTDFTYAFKNDEVEAPLQKKTQEA